MKCLVCCNKKKATKLLELSAAVLIGIGGVILISSKIKNC